MLSIRKYFYSDNPCMFVHFQLHKFKQLQSAANCGINVFLTAIFIFFNLCKTHQNTNDKTDCKYIFVQLVALFMQNNFEYKFSIFLIYGVKMQTLISSLTPITFINEGEYQRTVFLDISKR